MTHLLIALMLVGLWAVVFYPKKAGVLWARAWGAVSDAWGAAREAAALARDVRLRRSAAVYVNAGLAPADAPPAAPKTIDWLQVGRNFVGGLWKARKLIALVIVIALVWGVFAPVWSFVRCPFGGWGPLWCAAGSLEARLENAETNAAVSEHETDVATFGANRAEETHRVERAIDRAVVEGQEDVANVVSGEPRVVTEADFLELDRRYRAAYERVLGIDAVPSEPDPGAGRAAPLRGARGDNA